MISPQDASRLEQVVRRESRSLLQYVNDSFPWVRDGGDAPLTKLKASAHEEADAVGNLARFLARRHYLIGHLDSYPANFTTMNFVSLDYLLPRLAESQRQLVAALEGDRAALADGDARAEVDRMLDVKRRHLKALEALAPAAAPAMK